jgi:hypothetical protein
MDYGEILSKSWKIVWKFKVLWIFGVLAGCGQSRGGNNFNFNNSFRSGNGFSNPTPNLPPPVMDALNRFVRLFKDPAFLWQFVAIVIAVICVIVLVEIFLGTIGRIGLIKGSAEADAGTQALTFGGLWHESTPYFWRIFWLSFLIGTPFAIAIIAIVLGFVIALIPLASKDSSSMASLLILLPALCTLLCVIFLLAIILGFISIQAERAIVLENKSILVGFKRGWEVLTKNLGPILIIWLITAAIGVVAAIVIALPLLVVMVPLVIAFIANMNSLNFSFTPWIIAFICIICVYAPVSWFANGIVTAYLQSVWTLTYIRITRPTPEEQAPVDSPTNA